MLSTWFPPLNSSRNQEQMYYFGVAPKLGFAWDSVGTHWANKKTHGCFGERHFSRALPCFHMLSHAFTDFKMVFDKSRNAD